VYQFVTSLLPLCPEPHGPHDPSLSGLAKCGAAEYDGSMATSEQGKATRRKRRGPLTDAQLPTAEELTDARKRVAQAVKQEVTAVVVASSDTITLATDTPGGYWNSFALSVEIGLLFDKLDPSQGKIAVFRAECPSWEMACDRAGVDRMAWLKAPAEVRELMVRLSTLLARDHVYYAMALLKVAQRRAIEVFLECMEDANKWLRLQAAQSVASLGGLKAASVIEVEQRISGRVEVVFRAPGGAGRELESGTVVTVEPVRLPAPVLEEVADGV